MTLHLGAIADDFTGATDLAAMVARSGARVSLRIGVPDADAKSDADCEVIALKIRTEPVDDAIAQTDAALTWLQKHESKQAFWKYCSTFDSTSKGNIGPVADHLMTRLKATKTVYVPSFPQNGRTVYQGHLFVGDMLLSDSPMKDHPLTPMRDASLLRLLEPQVQGSVGLLPLHAVQAGPDHLRKMLDEATAPHLICDAVNGSDLDCIAAATAHLPLVTGGSAVAELLMAQHLQRASRASTAPRPDISDSKLVLSGSCSQMTRRQVAAFAALYPAYKLDPLALAEGPDALQTARHWLGEQADGIPKLVYATAEPDEVRRAQDALGIARAGAIVEDALAVLAQDAAAAGLGRLIVAGGETSGAVIKALGVNQLTIGPEIATGVPWTFAKLPGGPIALALKSGNFGEETFFEDAFSLL